MMCGAGVYAQNEVLTSRGRIDLLIEFLDKVYVIEFKCEQSADRAIKQILEKGYIDRFKGSGKSVYLTGIDFSKKERNIREWKVEQKELF